ncbi:MAG: His/Gly/Thr/Pro-type tRNA ligase C-terminal domain-containing protein, partial [Acidobacteriota bacterium]
RILASYLRRNGLRVSLDPGERSVKAQMRRAHRTGARFTLFLGETELANHVLNLRRLSDGRETSYPADETGRLVEEILRERP